VDCQQHGTFSATADSTHGTPYQIGLFLPVTGRRHPQSRKTTNHTTSEERRSFVAFGHNNTKQPPLAVLVTANAVTICLENQKNSHKNATLHHTSSNDAILNPVKSAAILIHALQNLPDTTPIGSFINDLAHV
jgi:hypothetical protein